MISREMAWWEILSGGFRVLLIMSLSGTVTALFFFALKPFLRDRLPKSAQYYLWLAVLAAYLVPFPLFVKAPAGGGLPSVGGFIQENVLSGYEYQEREMLRRTGHTSQLSDEQIRGMSDDELSQAVKVLGDTGNTKLMLNTVTLQLPLTAFLFLCVSTLSEYGMFTVKIRKRNQSARKEESAMLAALCGGGPAPRLCRNPLAATPMLIGLFRPTVILPDREYTEARLRAVLLHELTHFKRKDLLVKWLALFACSVHWFNPSVWLVRRGIDRACEFACDEAVIRNLNAEGRQQYGDTLIDAASGFKMPKAVLATTMCEEKKALKERLGAIMKYKRFSAGAVALSCVLVTAVLLGVVALSAPPPAVPPPARTPGIGSVPSDEGASRPEAAGAEAIGIVPESISVPQIVLDTAISFAEGDYEGYRNTGVAERKAYGAEFDNWRLDYVEHAYTYEDRNIEVYRFQWRVHTTTPDIVSATLVGGMDLDGGGWLLDTYPDSCYLLFDSSGDELTFLFAMMENDCAPGDELFKADMEGHLSADRNAEEDGGE